MNFTAALLELTEQTSGTPGLGLLLQLLSKTPPVLPP